MTTTATIERNKIIGDAFAEYEINRGPHPICTADEYTNEVLREHGLSPLAYADMKLLPNRARTDAIQEACKELATHESVIPCSRREYIDEALREIGQPRLTDEEHREFDISA